ncbi:insulinase family protein [Flavobacterium sufflavum]|uniref:Insulinase family protein n=2 Tax=Flavobacterium sufflavum TaxID=1921138 RepID=A0A3S2U5I8_9FLAO|nr:insulinase family protein [Flavobacterium sufflavum]
MQAQERKQPTPGKPPVVNIKKPQSFILANGLTVMIVENHKLPKVTFNLTIDNPPFAEGNKKGVDELCSNLLGNGSTKISKEDFNEEVDFMGATMEFSSSSAYASSLSKFSKRTLELLSFGALDPNFTQEELNKEKAKLIEGLRSQEKSASAIANRMVNTLAYGKNHPSGEFTTEETLSNITLEDVIKNYANNFVPQNAYLAIVGDIKYNEIKPLVEQLFGSWKKVNITKTLYPDPENVTTQINFIDVPNAVQSEISLVNTYKLKMNDKDFFPAVIASYILGGGFNSYLNMNLREAHGWTYGASTNMGAGKYVTSIRSASAIKNNVTDSAVVEFIKEIKKIRTEKVTTEQLNNAKAGYIGRFVMKAEKPESVARYALNTKIEDLPADFYENYIKTINAVTKEDVLAAANKYFLIDNSRIVIVGKGKEVIPGLEKLNIPISYFDKYGNPVEKPKF